MFKLKIIALFVFAATAVMAGMWFTYKSLDQLSGIMRQALLPDEGMVKLKELVAGVNDAESGVRTFAITQDQKYLEPYYKILNDIDDKRDSLKIHFTNNESGLDTVHSLLKSKLAIYNELIDVRYTNLISQEIEKISGKEKSEPDDKIQTDSLVADPVKRNFFQKLFGSKRKQELELKAQQLDSLKAVHAEKEEALQRRFQNIHQEENKRIQTISAKELDLLAADKIISARLDEALKKTEANKVFEKRKQAESIILKTSNERRQLTIITALGAAVIVLLVIVILLDINQSNRYKKQIITEKNRAEQLAKFKEEFLANMSHELRTPVSALSGFAARLLKTDLSDPQREYAKNISVSSAHLLNIVNDVLDISRIETGNLKLEKSDFSVYQTAKEVCDLLAVKALEKNIDLIFDGSTIKNISVSGDELRLRQVLINIAGNSVKFTEKGKVDLKITTERNPAGTTNFKFQISDTGIGIPREKLKVIFQPFEQADMGITRKYGGSGLGLSITKKIVELHGGKISAESEKGKGSIFTLEIPYEIIAENAKPQLEKEQAKQTGRPLEKIKILLAEDDELNRILQQMMLSDLGAHVDAVADGEEVLFRLQTGQYDILLMDLQMPEMGGIEAANKIRNDLQSNIPIVAITANVYSADKEKCFAAGINDILIKPFTEEQISVSILLLLKKGLAEDAKTEAASSEIISLPYNLKSLEKASNGNPDFVARMLKVFCMSGTSLFQKAEEGMIDLNKEKIASAVHRLIPSCRQLEMDELASQLKSIENLCENQPDVNAIGILLKSARQYFDNVVVLLEKEITNLEKTKA